MNEMCAIARRQRDTGFVTDYGYFERRNQMTREAAERVVQIYRNIETLKDIYKKLSDAHYVEIHASNESGIHTLCVECEKGKKNDKIVLHIIDGIEKDIKNLEEELKTL